MRVCSKFDDFDGTWSEYVDVMMCAGTVRQTSTCASVYWPHLARTGHRKWPKLTRYRPRFFVCGGSRVARALDEDEQDVDSKLGWGNIAPVLPSLPNLWIMSSVFGPLNNMKNLVLSATGMCMLKIPQQ